MTRLLRAWLVGKWSNKPDPNLTKSYYLTFATAHGQRVLQHLLDNVYFTTYEGIDANAALVHNARRGVVQEILENIDMGEHVDKYAIPVVEENGHVIR